MALAPALLAPPDEQTQDAALVANVVDPTLAPPPIARLPPAPGPSVEQLATLAAQPPAFARPDTPVDAAIAPALPPVDSVVPVPPPPPAPGAVPAPVPPTGTPATPVEAARANVDKLAALDVEQQKIADEKTRLETEQATAKAEHDRQRAEALSRLQERQERHRIQAASLVADARSKAESEPFHTLVESRSIGQNIISGIGLILGGVSWNPGHVNRGVQVLEAAMRENEMLQKEKHADLWRSVEAAERGERALDARELRETAAFSAKQGAAWDAVAGRLGAMIAANKGKGDTATAKRVMIEANEKAVAAWQNAETAAAAAAHLKELEAEARERNRIMEIRALKYKTKGTGGAGGGASGLEQAAVILQDKIAAAQKAGKPLGIEEIDRMASTGVDVPGVGKVRIPLVGKANTINARQIAKDAADSASKADLADSRKRAEDKETRERTVFVGTSRKPALAPTANDAKEYKIFESSAQQVEGALERLEANYAKHGVTPSAALPSWLQSQAARDRVAAMEAIVLPAKEVGRLGALAGPDKAILENITGGKVAQLLGDKVGINNIRGWLKRAREGALNSLGIDMSAGGGDRGVRVKQKSTGKEGYFKDGKFTPDDGGTIVL